MTINYINRQTGEIQTENPPGEKLLKFFYDNPFGKTAFLPIMKRKFVTEWAGRKMSKAKSVKKIVPFIESFGINMAESLKPASAFASFNEFFYRQLKPESRPIGQGFTSPGDGKLIAFEDTSSVCDFFVKGRKFNLTNFLKDKKLAEKYKHSSMLILRLAPNDYHRFHFPYNGTTTNTTQIKGHYFSVSPYALAKHFTKVFCENKRAYTELKTADKGDILIAPVGATMVGSIYTTFKPQTEVKKGDEMGYFAFGGSTIIMLIDKAKITIDNDILTNTKNKLETFVKMGESIGQ